MKLTGLKVKFVILCLVGQIRLYLRIFLSAICTTNKRITELVQHIHCYNS